MGRIKRCMLLILPKVTGHAHRIQCDLRTRTRLHRYQISPEKPWSEPACKLEGSRSDASTQTTFWTPSTNICPDVATIFIQLIQHSVQVLPDSSFLYSLKHAA